MAKKSVILRNNRRKKLCVVCKIKRDNLLAITKNQSLSGQERFLAQVKLSEMPRDSSRTRQRNRCSITGRPRGNLRKFNMSRIAVREYASWGQIPGLIKSSW